MTGKSLLGLLASLAVLTLVPGGGLAADRSPIGSTAPAQASAAETHLLRLGGPFGSVPSESTGSDPSHDGTAGAVLDSFVRQAPLRLEAGRPPTLMTEWLVTVLDQETGHGGILASSDPGEEPIASVRFLGPDVPGTHRVNAHVVTEDGQTIEGAWTLGVPDREPPEDGMLEVPAPELTLGAAAGTLTGWPGSGCYVYLCVEVGRLPPLRTLERLDVTAGEILQLRLSDGSRMASWEASYLPIVDGLQPATAQLVGSHAGPVSEFELPAPSAGAWLLMVEIDYDRERGWAEVFFRLTASDDPPEPDTGG